MSKLQYLKAPKATDLSACNWPSGQEFQVAKLDPADLHSAWYVVTPGGSMLTFNNCADDAQDEAQANWVAATLNAALATPPTAATSAYTPDATPSEEVPEEQIIEAIRDLAEDGGRWPSDWVEACRRAIKLATPAAATSTPCASGEGRAQLVAMAREIGQQVPAYGERGDPIMFYPEQLEAFAARLAAAQAPAVPATDRDPQGMSARAVELHEKAFMPWPDAQELAFSEAGYTDEDLHEFVGEHASGTRVLVEDEIEVFARAVLVHCSDILGCEPIARTPTAGNTEEPGAR